MSLLTLIFSILLFVVGSAFVPRRGLRVISRSETGFQVPCNMEKANMNLQGERAYLTAPVSCQGGPYNFAVISTTSGFGRLTSVGLTVTKGAKVLLNYNVTTKAIAADRLANMDSTYVDQLTASEKESYFREKRNYKGGLNIPFLEAVGIHLGGTTDCWTQLRSARGQSNYNSKSEAVKKTLEMVDETVININGRLEIMGVSSIPTVVFAFIKLATITFEDGSTKRVVTTDAEEIDAASTDRTVVVDTEDKILNVVSL